MSDYEHVTTDAAVATYETAIEVFKALLKEVRELSKKKPDATLSANKVKLVNAVLTDILTFLENEPEGKYLSPLEDEELPQVSDALMMMVQFEAGLAAFNKRYRKYISYGAFDGEHHWITEEQLATWNDADAEFEEEDDQDGS
ncbi:hypothetical protein [Citromicrobium sp. WPS32]|uniref:hypothetical protein n=1 Tax=Citromicrobium sp. WPS32 TaxID=1634517 RepID=UPI0006C90449|nr:hypothetical protein [Citromicrobium sp. WPS32]MAY77158.1 hypothetical protein [Citromicrobium sp.]|tara:strand:- start:252 stop:680 length:429 start_codon:yes stop_codon:yes gene_type:complete